MLLQHLIGLVSAVLLGAATRRVTGSAWAGLLPMAIVLLDPDVIFLEHSTMSESWVILAIAIALYAAVRSFDEPERWWRWPLLTGVALAAAMMIRSALLPMIPVVALAVLVAQSQPFRCWREHVRAAVTSVAAAAVLLLAFAGASAASGQRFGIEPSPGWYLTDASRSSPTASSSRRHPARPRFVRPCHHLGVRALTYTISNLSRRRCGCSATSAEMIPSSAGGRDVPWRHSSGTSSRPPGYT